MKRKTLLLAALFTVALAGQFALMNHKLVKTRKRMDKRLKKYRIEQKGLIFSLDKPQFTPFSLPRELRGISIPDKQFVLDVKNVKLRNVYAPYNGSLIEDGPDRFLLFFRYDRMHQMHFNTYHTFVGCAELNEAFEQTEKECIEVNTQSPHSEDPRVVKCGEERLLIYSDGPMGGLTDRKMHIARLDPQSFQPLSITRMDPGLAPIEKNWVPFIYDGSIHFEYQLFSPRTIFKLADPTSPELALVKDFPPIKNSEWVEKWGLPLGGTAARLVDGEYLAFFHSRFKDTEGICWYVMGAYTFEAAPPFRLTAMSREPLLYPGIYQTPSINTADPKKFVVFPCGYAIKQYGDQTLLHLSCGENDSAVKIITFDKERLLDSLVRIPCGDVRQDEREVSSEFPQPDEKSGLVKVRESCL